MRRLPRIADVQRLPQLRPGDSLIVSLGEGLVTPAVADYAERKIRAILRLDESVPVVVLGRNSGIEVLPSADTGPDNKCPNPLAHIEVRR